MMEWCGRSGHVPGTATRAVDVDERETPRTRSGAPSLGDAWASGRTGMSARIVLPTTMTAGSSMTGQVVVENGSGHSLHPSGCLSLFAVELGNDEITPNVGWLSCLQAFTIPLGESRYPVTVIASYIPCSPCPGGHLEPLPPGDYRATPFQSTPLVPTPPALSIRVTP